MQSVQSTGVLLDLPRGNSKTTDKKKEQVQRSNFNYVTKNIYFMY